VFIDVGGGEQKQRRWGDALGGNRLQTTSSGSGAAEQKIDMGS